MKNLSNLTENLSRIGVVEVIKDEYVFTLFMSKGEKPLDSGSIPFKVLGLATDEIVDKPNIEVFKNDSNFLVLVLKP